MADETQESCSFHEMGLDDRLVKVNIILPIKIMQKYFVCSSSRVLLFVYQAIAKLNWSQPSPIQVSKMFVMIKIVSLKLHCILLLIETKGKIFHVSMES